MNTTHTLMQTCFVLMQICFVFLLLITSLVVIRIWFIRKICKKWKDIIFEYLLSKPEQRQTALLDTMYLDLQKAENLMCWSLENFITFSDADTIRDGWKLYYIMLYRYKLSQLPGKTAETSGQALSEPLLKAVPGNSQPAHADATLTGTR